MQDISSHKWELVKSMVQGILRVSSFVRIDHWKGTSIPKKTAVDCTKNRCWAASSKCLPRSFNHHLNLSQHQTLTHMDMEDVHVTPSTSDFLTTRIRTSASKCIGGDRDPQKRSQYPKHEQPGGDSHPNSSASSCEEIARSSRG